MSESLEGPCELLGPGTKISVVLKVLRVPVKPSSAARDTAVAVRQKVATPACNLQWRVERFHLHSHSLWMEFKQMKRR